MGAVPIVLLLAVTYGVLARPRSAGIDERLAAGQSVNAPQFTLELLTGGRPGAVLDRRLRAAVVDGRLSLSQLRGTPVALNFWASWCVACREEAPRLQRAWRRLARPRGALFLGLDMQDVRSDAREFIRTFAIDYPSVRDPGNAVARRWGVTGIPETFFLSADGRIVGHVIGAATDTQLRDGIGAALSGRVMAADRGGARRPTR